MSKRYAVKSSPRTLLVNTKSLYILTCTSVMASLRRPTTVKGCMEKEIIGKRAANQEKDKCSHEFGGKHFFVSVLTNGTANVLCVYKRI